MMAFWLGTVPALLVAGVSAQGLGQWTKRRSLRRAAGALLIVVGLIAITLPLRHSGDHSGMQHHSSNQYESLWQRIEIFLTNGALLICTEI